MQDYATEIRKQQMPTFKDGKQALYISKLMLVKMAHKDWTPIDRQWVTSQAKRLRAVMPAMVHIGCEGTLMGMSVEALLPLDVGNTSSEITSGGAPDSYVDVQVDVPSELKDFAAKVVDLWVANDDTKLELVSGGGSPRSEKSSINSWDSYHDVDNNGVTLKLRLLLDDRELRLGLLKVDEAEQQDAGAAAAQGSAAVPGVDVREVRSDVKKLEAMIASVLGLNRPGKDSQQFRCDISHFFI
jgi:hypothetical protein